MKRELLTYFDEKVPLMGEFIYAAKPVGKAKTIILFPAFEGRGDFLVNYGLDLAAQGFNVFVADVYGNATVAKTLDECFALINPFLEDRALVRRRAVLAYQAVIRHLGSAAHHIGAMGFCFGGMLVLELARAGKNLWAGVCAHSNLSHSTLPAEKMHGKYLILHGYEDPQVPPSNLAGFAEEMQQGGVDDWTFVFFGHAKHSFTDPATGSFDAKKEKEIGRAYSEIAATRAFNYAVEFFKE